MYHARASHRWPLMNNQYIPLKTIRESCGCLAGGASERAGCVGLMLMEQFNMAKECQLIEFEDIVGICFERPQGSAVSTNWSGCTKVHEQCCLSWLLFFYLS